MGNKPIAQRAVIALRFMAALLPVAMLWISKLIVDQVVATISRRSVVMSKSGGCLALKSRWPCSSDALSRATALCDSLLGDRFTNYVNLRMMAHATQLDLVSFEDPVFYDKMERARRQTTSRLGMLASLASMAQQTITLLSLSAGIVAFSPWLLLLLIAAVVPPFLGETKFAMLAYSLLYQWTPERRELDYLRMLGASNASAKEVKIFGLGEHLTERARTLFDRFYNDNRGSGHQTRGHGHAVESTSDGRVLHRVCIYPLPCACRYADGR